MKVGDLVQSQDPKTGAISLRRVTQVHVRPIEKINTFYKLTVSKDGAEENFYVTGEHPFWIADKAEWRSVDELSVGDALADFGGHRLRVSAKAAVSEKQQTYNISVEGNATYFAGRSEVLVHNNNCGPGIPANPFLPPADQPLLLTYTPTTYTPAGRGVVCAGAIWLCGAAIFPGASGHVQWRANHRIGRTLRRCASDGSER